MDSTPEQLITIELPRAVWMTIAAHLDDIVDRSQREGGRRTVEIETNALGRTSLVISELPGGVDANRVFQSIADQRKDGAFPGLRGMHNESFDPDAVRLVLSLGSDADVEEVRDAVVGQIARIHQETVESARRIREAGTQQIRSAVDEGTTVPITLDRVDWEFVEADADRRASAQAENADPAAERAEQVVDAMCTHLRAPIVEVLSGELEPGLRWVIEAGGSDEDFSTMLYVYRDGKLVEGSGMRGPKLDGESRLNASYGQTGDRPYSETIRVHPSVDRVVVTTQHGVDVPAVLSDPVPEFGLRFGAAFLPEGSGPAEIRAEIDGTTVETESQHHFRFDR